MSTRPDEEILELVSQLMHGIKARIQTGLRVHTPDLAPMEARALTFVARQPGCSQADIVDRSGRDKGQIARLVKGLLDRGLLDHAVGAGPRRGKGLVLTEAGRALQKKVQHERRRLALDLVAGLSEREREQAVRLLERMMASIDVTPH